MLHPGKLKYLLHEATHGVKLSGHSTPFCASLSASQPAWLLFWTIQIKWALFWQEFHAAVVASTLYTVTLDNPTQISNHQQ